MCCAWRRGRGEEGRGELRDFNAGGSVVDSDTVSVSARVNCHDAFSFFFFCATLIFFFFRLHVFYILANHVQVE